MSETRKPKAKKPAVGQKSLNHEAEDLGKTVEPIGAEAGKVIAPVLNRFLTGVKNPVYNYDKIGEWLQDRLIQEMQNVSPEAIVEPNPRTAVPVVHALIYSMAEEHISDMFAKLLATDMNVNRKGKAHTAFVGIIMEMTTADARALKLFRKEPQAEIVGHLVDKTGQVRDLSVDLSFWIGGYLIANLRSSVDNLLRLALIEKRYNVGPITRLVEESRKRMSDYLEVTYAAKLSDPEFIRQMKLEPPLRLSTKTHGLFLTAWGRDFVDVCLGQN